jgi:hypothetical protein
VAKAANRIGLTGGLTLRMAGEAPFVTDGGHFILDASFGRIPDTRALSNALHAIPGVVEHGLFLGMAIGYSRVLYFGGWQEASFGRTDRDARVAAGRRYLAAWYRPRFGGSVS